MALNMGDINCFMLSLVQKIQLQHFYYFAQTYDDQWRII